MHTECWESFRKHKKLKPHPKFMDDIILEEENHLIIVLYIKATRNPCLLFSIPIYVTDKLSYFTFL
jgi:hypothetical protein